MYSLSKDEGAMLERAFPIFESLERAMDPGGRNSMAIRSIAKQRSIVFEKLFYDLFTLCIKEWVLLPHYIIDFM